MAKISQCAPTSSTLSVDACSSYTSPSGTFTWLSSGNYIDVIPNFLGCDSIISINLIINSVSTNITQNGIELTATFSGANYQWLNCDSGFMAIPMANNQNFIPIYNGNYAVVVSNGICVDTSACYNITGVSLIDNLINNEATVADYGNGWFNIDLGSEISNIEVSILNPLNQLMKTSYYKNVSNFNIELNGPSGFYIVKMRNDEHVWTVKLLKL